MSKARVVYNYKPTQADELQLQLGEIINVLDKNLEDEGWWKGEINGRIGVFPDNFVEEIVETQKKLTTTSPPPPPIIPNNTANFTNSNALLIDNNTSNTSKLQVSSSSASSSTSSLVVATPVQPQQMPQPPQQLNTSIETTNELNESLKLDEVQSDNKLTHLKKTKQNNKRPPSFRLKSRGEEIQDAETLLSQLSSSTDASEVATKTTTNTLANEVNLNEVLKKLKFIVLLYFYRTNKLTSHTLLMSSHHLRLRHHRHHHHPTQALLIQHQI